MRGRSRSEKIDALRHVPLFGGLSKRDVGYVASIATSYMVEPERPLVVEHERSGGCLVLLSGKARVEVGGRTVAHMGTGEVVGEISLIDGLPRSATVVAEEWTEVLAIDNRDFKPLLRSSPNLQYKLLLTLCSRLREAHESWSR